MGVAGARASVNITAVDTQRGDFSKKKRTKNGTIKMQLVPGIKVGQLTEPPADADLSVDLNADAGSDWKCEFRCCSNRKSQTPC